MPTSLVALLVVPVAAGVAGWMTRVAGRRAEERRQAQMLERVSDAYIALDRAWRFTYVNQKAAQLFGRDPRSLVGRHIWTEFPGMVNRPSHQACERAMAEQRPVVFEGPAPGDRWFEGRLFPSSEGLAIFATDISDRRRAERAARDERGFSSVLLDSLPGVFYLYDDRRRFLRWNRNFETVTGYTAAEIAGMSPLDFFTEAERDVVARRIGDVFAHGTSSVEADFVSRDGTRRRYFFTGLRTEVDGQACLAGVGIDISDRRRAELELQESEARLRLALEAARMGTFDWDVPGNRITWSRWHEDLWGFAPGEFAGTYESFASRVQPDDLAAMNDELARCIEQRAPFVREFRVIWPDRSVHWVVGRGEFSFDAEGRPLRMRGVVVEVTERREAEERRREYALALSALTDRLQTVRDEEATRISRELHDELGQALTGLRIDISWLDRRLLELQDAGQLHDKVRAMGGQVDETLQAVRRLSTELRPLILDDLGLGAAIEWQVQEFQKRTGVTCTAHLLVDDAAASPSTATALFRILQESLTNVARHAQASQVTVTLSASGEELCLSVADNGRGMPSSPAAKSLGILGMRERAHAHGGAVAVSSGPGGTTVEARMPRE